MSTLSRTAKPVPTPVSKTLLRQPTLIRKRNDAEDDTPSSPGKRPKVTFDSNVEVRVMGDWEKAPKLIQEEVRRALEQQAFGDTSGYSQVKEIYAVQRKLEDEPSTITLRSHTSALLGNVSLLNRSRADLVHAVLNSQWLGRNDDYATLYVRLLANLVSTQGAFLSDVLRMLVDNLSAGRFGKFAITG